MGIFGSFDEVQYGDPRAMVQQTEELITAGKRVITEVYFVHDVCFANDVRFAREKRSTSHHFAAKPQNIIAAKAATSFAPPAQTSRFPGGFASSGSEAAVFINEQSECLHQGEARLPSLCYRGVLCVIFPAWPHAFSGEFSGGMRPYPVQFSDAQFSIVRRSTRENSRSLLVTRVSPFALA